MNPVLFCFGVLIPSDASFVTMSCDLTCAVQFGFFATFVTVCAVQFDVFETDSLDETKVASGDRPMYNSFKKRLSSDTDIPNLQVV
jgi:hypothetical protein